MKSYSLSRRLVVTVLLVQLLLTGCITGIALLYEKQQHFRSFDMMLRGRADSLLGAVSDADDEADNVVLDTAALDLPKSDIFEVEEASGRVLGQSQNWTGIHAAEIARSQQGRSFRVHGRWYRGLAVPGARRVDEEHGRPGISRPVVVLYAAPLEPVWEDLRHAAQYLILSNSVVLLLTGAVLLFLLRRGLMPVRALAREASNVSGAALQFRAPPEALAVKELAVLATTLESSMQSLARAFDQQRMFLHDAAHEMKTAMTIVKSSLQRLSYRPRTATEYQQGLEVCLTDYARMEELVQKMLTLARLEQVSTSDARVRAPIPAAEAVREALAQIEPLATLRRLEVRSRLEENAWVAVPPEELETLLTNLLVNAVQHSTDGSLLEVTAITSGSAVELSVRDTGEGIAAADLPFVFDRFYRGDRSRSRASGGTGLGLSICKAIVDGYGGTISAESEPGKGTRVLVRLPSADAAQQRAGVQPIFMKHP